MNLLSPIVVLALFTGLCFLAVVLVFDLVDKSDFVVRINTEYPQGFDEKRLKTLEYGLSSSQVREILGNPFWVQSIGTHPACFAYTRGRYTLPIPFVQLGVRKVATCFDSSENYVQLLDYVL